MTAKVDWIGYTYNGFNQQSATNMNQTNTSYRYADTGNQLLTKTVTSGTTTTYTNGLLGVTGTQVGSGSPVWFTRDPAGTLISMRVGTATSFTSSYYLTDQQGSVLRLINPVATKGWPAGTRVRDFGQLPAASRYHLPRGKILLVACDKHVSDSHGPRDDDALPENLGGITVAALVREHAVADMATPDFQLTVQPVPH